MGCPKRAGTRAGTFASRLLAACVAILAAGALAGAARADAVAELVDRYAPVLELKTQAEECGPGEPFVPIDVDAILPNPEVALRGPWDTTNVVAVAPDAGELARGLTGYHLDFPGNPLDPGCDYELWAERLAGTYPATTYARVATQADRPGQLALQYWFFYPYNDFNNKHEGDWEMIQLLFAAATPEAALAAAPVAVGYSQHEGAERAAWGEPKLQLADGTHPVVYPAAGSHANYYEQALYLGRSAAQGVGCDDTIGPSTAVRPAVAVVPADAAAYLPLYPWLGYDGHWGELQPSFYNGPTGPNTKLQWAEPITWAEEEWRDRSFALGSSNPVGPSATQFFCDAIAWGSNLLTRLTNDPAPVLIGLGAVIALVLVAAYRTAWRPSAPLRVLRRRQWGQILTASGRMYFEHFGLFAGIGLVFVPLLLLVAGIQYLLFELTGLGGLLESAGETNAFVVTPVLMLGLIVAVLALTIVQATTARALFELDAGRPVGIRSTARMVRDAWRPLAVALLIVGAVVLLLSLTVVGIPIAVWLVGRWAFLAQVVELEETTGRQALRRSGALVRGRWFRTSLVVVVIVGFGLVLGPLVGVLLLFATSASFAFVNIVASVVYVVTIPFVSLATTYLYADLRVRETLEPARAQPALLPAELA